MKARAKRAEAAAGGLRDPAVMGWSIQTVMGQMLALCGLDTVWVYKLLNPTPETWPVSAET